MPSRGGRYFCDDIVKIPLVRKTSKNPQLWDGAPSVLGRLAQGLVHRTLWVCDFRLGHSVPRATNPGTTPLRALEGGPPGPTVSYLQNSMRSRPNWKARILQSLRAREGESSRPSPPTKPGDRQLRRGPLASIPLLPRPESSIGGHCNDLFERSWRSRLQASRLVAALGVSARAEEIGHWKGRGVLVVTNAPMVKVLDSSVIQVGLREMDGAIFNEGGKVVLAAARTKLSASTPRPTWWRIARRQADDGSHIFAKYKNLGGSPPTFTVNGHLLGVPENTKGSPATASSRSLGSRTHRLGPTRGGLRDSWPMTCQC